LTRTFTSHTWETTTRAVTTDDSEVEVNVWMGLVQILARARAGPRDPRDADADAGVQERKHGGKRMSRQMVNFRSVHSRSHSS
jgi:hypothetical protein